MQSRSVSDGTALASSDQIVSAPRYQAIRATEVRKRAVGWVRRRPRMFLPAYAVVIPFLTLAGYPWQRVMTAALACAALSAWWIVDAFRPHEEVPSEGHFFVSGLLSTILYTVLCAVTGGSTSPLLPLLPGPAVGLFILYGRSRMTNLAVAMLLVPLALLLLLPPAWHGPDIHWPWGGLLAAFSVLYTGVFLHTSAMLLVDAYREAGQTLDRMREELLLGSTRRSQAIESMGAKVAHELKNPLAAVKGLVQLLGKSAADGRSRERIGVVSNELDRMEAIIADYLSFSRPLEALDPRPVELGALVDEVLAVLEARAREARVAMVRAGDATVTGDGRRLKEALLNLVANAIEASRAGAKVRVDIVDTLAGASVVVSDSGEGLTPEDLSRLGTPFFTRRDNGTGLGVVLARAAVVQHGGDIAFESERGRGTVVTLTLPRSPPVREAAHG